jgi:hypothetical protein
VVGHSWLMLPKAFALVLLIPISAFCQTLHFGTNLITPGVITEFSAPLNMKARYEVSRIKLQATHAQGALLLPEGFDLRKPWPLLIVNVPSGGRSIPMMGAYTNVALSLGYAVLAADGPQVPQQLDSIQFGWSMLASVLEQMVRTWPQTKTWPMMPAGFSGGAKRAATVAAAMMHDRYRVGGIFVGGCNIDESLGEDRATFGFKQYQPGEAFKFVPIFLSNGRTDPIAGPERAAEVRSSMQNSGFRNVRAEIYDGGHQLNQENLKAALLWFKTPSKPSAPVLSK